MNTFAPTHLPLFTYPLYIVCSTLSSPSGTHQSVKTYVDHPAYSISSHIPYHSPLALDLILKAYQPASADMIPPATSSPFTTSHPLPAAAVAAPIPDLLKCAHHLLMAMDQLLPIHPTAISSGSLYLAVENELRFIQSPSTLISNPLHPQILIHFIIMLINPNIVTFRFNTTTYCNQSGIGGGGGGGSTSLASVLSSSNLQQQQQNFHTQALPQSPSSSSSSSSHFPVGAVESTMETKFLNLQVTLPQEQIVVLRRHAVNFAPLPPKPFPPTITFSANQGVPKLRNVELNQLTQMRFATRLGVSCNIPTCYNTGQPHASMVISCKFKPKILMVLIDYGTANTLNSGGTAFSSSFSSDIPIILHEMFTDESVIAGDGVSRDPPYLTLPCSIATQVTCSSWMISIPNNANNSGGGGGGGGNNSSGEGGGVGGSTAQSSIPPSSKSSPSLYHHQLMNMNNNGQHHTQPPQHINTNTQKDVNLMTTPVMAMGNPSSSSSYSPANAPPPSATSSSSSSSSPSANTNLPTVYRISSAIAYDLNEKKFCCYMPIGGPSSHNGGGGGRGRGGNNNNSKTQQQPKQIVRVQETGTSVLDGWAMLQHDRPVLFLCEYAS